MDLIDLSTAIGASTEHVAVRAAGTPAVPFRRWSLATAANLATEHGMCLDTLATGRPAAVIAKLLSSEWGISTRAEAVEVCDWLTRSGHRAEFDKAIENRVGVDLHHEADARAALDELRELDIYRSEYTPSAAVWDVSRVVHVARCSFDLGFLTENEAWDRIQGATAHLTGRYGSWAELSANYLLAWRIWRPTDHRFADRVAEHRTLMTGVNSPWNVLDW
jgi:hypothetical protein